MSAEEPNTIPTLDAAFRAFLNEMRAQVRSGQRSAATLAMHELHARYVCAAIAPTTPIARIDRMVVHSAGDAIAQGQRGPLSAGTVSKRMCTLRMALAAALDRGWIEHLPPFPRFRRHHRPRTAHLRAPDELAALCANLPSDRAAWIMLATFTGQHAGDVERMRAYVDADPFVEPPWFRRRNTKNRRPEQVMVMPAPLAAHLRGWFTARELGPGQKIVPAWPKDSRAKTLRRLGPKLGLSLTRATDLRHTCATWAIHELGSVTAGVRDWLGHSSFQMLERVYAHALPAAFADVAAALSRAAQAPRRPPQKVPPTSMLGAGKRKPPIAASPAKADSGEGSGPARRRPSRE
jgi:integrase